MFRVSDETERELRDASRALVRDEERLKKTRARVHAAIVAHKLGGASVRAITDIAPYQRGRVTSVLDEAGLVEKKTKPPPDNS